MSRKWIEALALATVLLLTLAVAGGCGANASPPGDAERTSTSTQALTANGLSTAPLQLEVLTNSCGANQVEDFFQITNNGTTPVALSDIAIKFWVDDTSGQAIVPHVWTGGCVTNVDGNPSCVHQVTNVTPSPTPFSPACGPDPAHQANWEITITDTDSASLPPGATWSNLQAALTLGNYANFTPGTADWFSPCLGGAGYASDPHFAVYYQGNLVFSNGIDAPDCRAPHGMQQLQGYVSILPPTMAPVVGPVAPSTPLTLDVGLPAQPGLQNFVQEVSDPHSPMFRKYITDLTTFAETFGASVDAYQQTMGWAQGAGLTVTNTFPNNLLLRVSGTAAQIEQALFVNLVYRSRNDGTQFVAVDREPSVNLSPSLLWISGLDDFLPLATAGGSAPGTFASTQNYWGYDMREAYFQDCLTLPGGVPLDGTGETVGVLAFHTWMSNSSDIQGYDNSVNAAATDPAQTPPLQAGNVIDSGTFNVALGGGVPGGTLEVISDIEAVQSMAPGAQVLVFTGDLSVEDHNDGLYHAAASHMPALSAVTNSFSMGFSPNAQQAVWEMAAQGTSYFATSGDFGNVGDPSNNTDMDGQTLVGGTILNTSGLSKPPAIYPTKYYTFDASWVDSNGASSGGIMDGHTQCYAFGICPHQHPRPDYQASVPMDTNGGSPDFRDYPDVAMNVYFVEDYAGSISGFVGTSVAGPLWAGVAALIDQRAKVVGADKLGFANPTIYDIGITRGTANDLYTNGAFNDVDDGNINQTTCSLGSCFKFGDFVGIPGNMCTCPPSRDDLLGGFHAVAGYDLVTGWGTPTCQFINQASSNAPLTGETALSEVNVQIITGKDDLRTNSAATACVTFVGSNDCVPLGASDSSGATFIKPANSGSFDAGEIQAFQIVIPRGLNLTPDVVAAGLGGIASITFNLIENPSNASIDEDNWDIGAVNVRLFTPGDVGEVCQFDAVDTVGKLANTNEPGVVRLTASSGSSGSGPNVTLAATGCAQTGSPLPAAPAQAQFIISTGNDSIRGDSDAQLQVFGADTSAAPFLQQSLPSGNREGDVFNVILPLPADAPPPNQWNVVLTLTTHNNLLETNDHWDVGGVNVMTWSADGREQCVLLAQGDPAVSQLLGSVTLPANNCH